MRISLKTPTSTLLLSSLFRKGIAAALLTVMFTFQLSIADNGGGTMHLDTSMVMGTSDSIFYVAILNDTTAKKLTIITLTGGQFCGGYSFDWNCSDDTLLMWYEYQGEACDTSGYLQCTSIFSYTKACLLTIRDTLDNYEIVDTTFDLDVSETGMVFTRCFNTKITDTVQRVEIATNPTIGKLTFDRFSLADYCFYPTFYWEYYNDTLLFWNNCSGQYYDTLRYKQFTATFLYSGVKTLTIIDTTLDYDTTLQLSPAVVTINDHPPPATRLPFTITTIGRSASVRITFIDQPSDRHWSVSIYSLKGALTNRLVSETTSGSSIVWNGNDRNGKTVPTGTYLLVVSDRKRKYAHTVQLVR